LNRYADLIQMWTRLKEALKLEVAKAATGPQATQRMTRSVAHAGINSLEPTAAVSGDSCVGVGHVTRECRQGGGEEGKDLGKISGCLKSRLPAS
jgi:hypothetical protein